MRAFMKFALGGPRLPFGVPTLWNVDFLHFEVRNHCFNPTAVGYVIVFNLRYVKNVKLKHFRGPLSSKAPDASCPPLLPSSLSAAMLPAIRGSISLSGNWNFTKENSKFDQIYKQHTLRFLLVDYDSFRLWVKIERLSKMWMQINLYLWTAPDLKKNKI